MKLSYNWLKDYLKCDLSPAEIAEAMTNIGIEVDSVEEEEEVPGGLEGVVVAEVVECRAHPDSDHLHITRVDDGSGESLTVICGAPNVAAGQKVLFARIGTVLPGNFRIRKSRIRGVESMGMICAEDELGIGGDHSGIKVLPADAVVGTPAKEYLGLRTEAVIEYEITANRADAASHIGVARDLYAYMVLNDIPCEFSYPAVEDIPEGTEGICTSAVDINGAIPIELACPDGAPRYIGVTICGVRTGPSPEWLQRRLTAIGLHPINNVVDVSNFMLFEMGQPLHTFDADKVTGNKVIVRRAEEGEKLVTLDGTERSLRASDIVIANVEEPMCIAGVFGGENSGVTDETRNVFLEIAYFDPASIRKTSKVHGLQTDASFRYERGVDWNNTLYCARRATALILEVAGGRVAGKLQECYPGKLQKKIIELDYDRMERLIGKKVGHDTIEKILKALAYEFIEVREGGSTVAAPAYMVDVYRECDVVEEVLRIYGYNNIEIPGHMQMSVSPTPSPDPEAVRNCISNFLAANGFAETMNNSLSRSAYYTDLQTYPQAACVRIVNPLSADLNVMRQTLIFNGLEVVAYNLNRQVSSIKTFEYGSVYSFKGGGATLDSYEEHACFTLIMSGPAAQSWRHETAKGSYFQLKGYLELLLRRYGADIYNLLTEPAPQDIFAEGLVYRLPGSKTPIAVMGTVAPGLAGKFDVKQPVFAAEINWDGLLTLVKRVKVRFSELPKFPEVRRDLAILVDESANYADLRRCALKAAGKMLTQVGLFDVYRGDKIPEGRKQYAMSFVLQNPEKTLTDEEVSRIMERIFSAFQKEFAASLR